LVHIVAAHDLQSFDDGGIDRDGSKPVQRPRWPVDPLSRCGLNRQAPYMRSPSWEVTQPKRRKV
jgi:hypothetical protein